MITKSYPITFAVVAVVIFIVYVLCGRNLWCNIESFFWYVKYSFYYCAKSSVNSQSFIIENYRFKERCVDEKFWKLITVSCDVGLIKTTFQYRALAAAVNKFFMLIAFWVNCFSCFSFFWSECKKRSVNTF